MRENFIYLLCLLALTLGAKQIAGGTPSPVLPKRPTTTAPPSRHPTPRPSSHPTPRPSSKRPTLIPSAPPSARSTERPTRPTSAPSPKPTYCKTCPTPIPSKEPSSSPTLHPTPTPEPTHTSDVNPYPPGFIWPTEHPTAAPNWPTHLPTPAPSGHPTLRPSCRPSPRPSARPSEDPTARPTQQPTDTGTVVIRIDFQATQTISGCSLAEASATPQTLDRYKAALTLTVAKSLDPFSQRNVITANVQGLAISAAPAGAMAAAERSAEGRRRRLEKSRAKSPVLPSAITITYSVHLVSYGQWDYAYFSDLLEHSVGEGFFDVEMHKFAQLRAFNATGLYSASSRAVSISLLSLTLTGPSAVKTIWTTALILGLAFGLGGGVCVLVTVCWLSSKGPRPWEDGYEEWFWKNERKLRESGIGVDHETPPYDYYEEEEYGEPPVDDIPELQASTPADPGHSYSHSGAGAGADATDATTSAGAGGDAEASASSAVVSNPITLYPSQRAKLSVADASGGQTHSAAPWAIDERESEGDFSRRL